MIKNMNKLFGKIIVTCVFLVGGYIAHHRFYSIWAPYRDFDTSMVNGSSFNLDYKKLLQPGSKTASQFAFLRKLYNKNYFTNIAPAHEVKIPKIIHQIWLGSPFPERYKAWQQTWKNKHSDWEYKLWTDNDVKSFKLTNQSLFDAAKNYGEKSDIFRYEILYRHGGLYVDTDFECLKPLDFLHYRYDFYSCLIPPDSGLQCGIGILAAKPGHPILKKVIEALKQHAKHNNTLTRTGPTFFTNILLQELPRVDGTNIIFPANYFYPFSFTQKRLGYWFPWWWTRPETLGVHYWAGSWIEQSWKKSLQYHMSRLMDKFR